MALPLTDSWPTGADQALPLTDTIPLERVTDPATIEFSDLLAGYGLTQHVTGATHDAGGIHWT